MGHSVSTFGEWRARASIVDDEDACWGRANAEESLVGVAGVCEGAATPALVD